MKRRTEYRWFPATRYSGLLGGICARTRDEALTWVDPMTQNDTDFRMVRVKLEYEPPFKRASRRARGTRK